MRIVLPNQPKAGFIHTLLRGLLMLTCVLWSFWARAQSALPLPFFDDFAQKPSQGASERPDSTKWVTGSGVYINNTMAINQPSVNVATFDGLQANGKPYVWNNPLNQDYTDTLQSQPINLSGLSAASNVYLSFYWQAKGLGELPDPGAIQVQKPDTTVIKPGDVISPYDKQVTINGVLMNIHIDTLITQNADSLLLQFKDINGNWRNVWAKAGGQADSVFNKAFIHITDPIYLYNGFAFRFRSFGRSSGPFDTWNLDYVYLNKGRDPADPTFSYMIDVAATRILSPLLKNYSAMPMSQFRIKGAAELADTVGTIINNLIPNPNPIPHRLLVSDIVSGRQLQNTLSPSIYVSGFQSRSAKPGFAVDVTQPKALLRYQIALETTDYQNTIFTPATTPLLKNDSIAAIAALDNYYAYDDGSWEYAYQIHQREQIAVRYILNKPDTVGSIRACIVPFTTNQTGQSFVLTVYGNNKGKPGIALYQQAFTMQYANSRNGFVDYTFTKGVIVKDTFFVGYQQVSSADTSLLRLGFDKSSPFGKNIFYNGSANWQQNLQTDSTGKPLNSLQLQGAFMLRPVMGSKSAVVTAINDPEPLPVLLAYPNPTTGQIRWDNTKLTRLDVITITGQTLLSVEPSRGQQTLDVSHLPDGLYLLRLFSNQQVVTQKLIVQH